MLLRLRCVLRLEGLILGQKLLEVILDLVLLVPPRRLLLFEDLGELFLVLRILIFAFFDLSLKQAVDFLKLRLQAISALSNLSQ